MKILYWVWNTFFVLFTLFLLCIILFLIGMEIINFGPDFQPQLSYNGPNTAAALLVLSVLYWLPALLFFMVRRIIINNPLGMKIYCGFGVLCGIAEMCLIIFYIKYFAPIGILGILLTIGVCFGFLGLCRLLRFLFGLAGQALRVRAGKGRPE